MKRIKNLGRYQKGILILMAAMILIFTVLYSVTIAREGFEYKDTILIPQQEDGYTTYSGKIKGKQAVFTVFDDKTVEFQYGDKVYGPYVSKEDPTILVKDVDFGEHLKRIELYRGEDRLFRGGVLNNSGQWWLYNEDGSLANFHISYVDSDGREWDEEGNLIDSMEPDVCTILDLMNDPKISHKGEWSVWFYGVIICIITAVSILFADELFRFNLAFQIRDAEKVEPSEWEIAGRYISWTVLPILAMVVFVLGLQ